MIKIYPANKISRRAAETAENVVGLQPPNNRSKIVVSRPVATASLAIFGCGRDRSRPYRNSFSTPSV
ncbi:MAG: hypothetical protein K2I89_10270 [Muribaculaceae bacterium]|nr:hypothetical protein [Muribaculaceae bacterium]MDE5595940.1 hypothetical protein [Muribaculaceae bacterium]